MNSLKNVSVELNRTFTHHINNVSFGSLSDEVVASICKDGRVFSHFIEKWLELHYPLKHVSGCGPYDFTDEIYPDTRYDEKTFTKGGCLFMPSSMIGTGRTFDKEVFVEKTSKLIFCIVSNINFPQIRIKFVRGTDPLVLYPKGKIPLKDHFKFFD